MLPMLVSFSLRRRMHPGALFLCAQAGCGKRFKTRNAVELHRSTVGHGEAPFRIVGSSPPDKGWSLNDVLNEMGEDEKLPKFAHEYERI